MLSHVLLAAPLLALAVANLDHPALTNDLDYLQPGNEAALPSVPATKSQWDGTTIPSDCKDLANNEKKNPADMQIFNVTYSDCEAPWVFCYHKDTEVSIDVLIDNYSKVPTHLRDWNKHVVSFPSDNGYAYNTGGNVVFFRPVEQMVDTMIHESGHSIDGQGGMTNYPNGYSNQPVWQSAYDADLNVPDNYAQTNLVEDFAQNVVVATYDLNVQGGFAGAQQDWEKIKNQFQAVERDSADQLKSGGTCNRHLEPSNPVPVSGDAKMVRRGAASWFGAKYDVVEPNTGFNTKGLCKH